MKTLIVKLGATGDVVRTSTLLRRLRGDVTWITTAANRSILPPVLDWNDETRFHVIAWEEISSLGSDTFDLVINLEDEPALARWLSSLHVGRIFGAYLAPDGTMAYTDDARAWFDMSLISVHGRKAADALKLQNRNSYQEMIFQGLGWAFRGDEYVLPSTPPSDLQGDVAIATESGAVWPMKKWAHYGDLKAELEAQGLRVNLLQKRPTMLEHLADIRGHRCLVSGDTLPMHLALGSGVSGVALFNCTSPWEIYDYGRLTKLVSPLLAELFYSREFDPRSLTAIPLENVYHATMKTLNCSAAPRPA